MTFTLIRRIFYMNSTFIHATFFWREASALYNTIPKEYYYFLLHHLWIKVRRWFFLCVNYLARSAKTLVSKREKPFFSPKNSKKFFFLCKTPYLSTKLRFSVLKKLNQEVFSISGGSYRPVCTPSWLFAIRNLGYCYPLGRLDPQKPRSLTH